MILHLKEYNDEDLDSLHPNKYVTQTNNYASCERVAPRSDSIKRMLWEIQTLLSVEANNDLIDIPSDLSKISIKIA